MGTTLSPNVGSTRILLSVHCHLTTLADVPAVTGEEWFAGTNADPILVPITESGVQKVRPNVLLHDH